MKRKRRIGYFFNSSLFDVNSVQTFESELRRFNRDKNMPEGCLATECITKKGTNEIIAVKCSCDGVDNLRCHPVLDGCVLWNQWINNTNQEYIEMLGVEAFLTASAE